MFQDFLTMALALRDKAVCELSRACGTAGILDGKPNHRGRVDSLYRLGTGLSMTGSNPEQPAISRNSSSSPVLRPISAV